LSDHHSIHDVKVFVKKYDKLPELANPSGISNLEDLSADISRLTNAGWRITYFSSAINEGKLVCVFVMELGPLIMKGPSGDLFSGAGMS
jgi:hypothetical protein